MRPSTLARVLPAVLVVTLALPLAARAQHGATPPAAAPAGQAPVPQDFLFSGGDPATPVARVDADVITAGELAEVLAASHGQHAGPAKAGAKDPLPVLERLIDAKLIVAEARDSQIDQLPQVKEKIGALEEARVKDILRQRALEGVKADPAKVKRAYLDLVTVYRMHAVNFDTEAGARELVARVGKGTAFADAAKALAADKKATDAGPGEMPAARFDPVFGPVLRRTKPGTLTPPTRIGKTWVVAKVLEVVRKDDPAAQAEAEESNLTAVREETLQRYYRDLAQRHAVVDRALLKKLDYHAPKPGATALKKDKRVIATLDGGTRLTVADLSTELERHFWHGLEDAVPKKKINSRIGTTFDSLLFRSLLVQEGARLKVRESPEFQRPVRAATDKLLFTAYLENAIAPGIQVTDDEARKYYSDHLADYRTPPLVAMELVAFTGVKEAQAGLNRLKSGTDLKWLRANADGVIPAEAQQLKVQEGVPVTLPSLPAGLAKALGGAREGDYRLYEAPEGETYVVRLSKEFPAGQQPFEDVAEAIRQRLFSAKVDESIKSLAKKLREHHQVQVLLAGSGQR
jgi:parvulin-like peptidyl-prolyl isomerase